MKYLKLTKNKYISLDDVAYLLSISINSILSIDQEYDLIKKSQHGDKQALETLVKHNIPFIISISQHYSTTTTSFEDIVQSAFIGLLKGIQDFDLTQNTRLLTFAVCKIRAEINKYLFNESNLVRIPYYQHARNGKQTNITVNFDAYEHVELDTPHPEIREALLSFIDTLTEKEQFIIKSFYGIDTPPLSLKKIAESLLIKTSTVSIIKRKILDNLKNLISGTDLEDDYRQNIIY